MKKSHFYKKYYEITDRVFSDHVIWTRRDREKAWRKGQHHVSKIERKIFIVIQYLILLVSWISLIFTPYRVTVFFVSLVLFFLAHLLTEFSLLKIEILFYLYNRNSIYCDILYKIFLGEFSDINDALKRSTKKHVIGYVYKSGQGFYAKYFAVCRERNNKVTLIFHHNHVTVKVNGNTHIIKDKHILIDELIADISKTISKELSTNTT